MAKKPEKAAAEKVGGEPKKKISEPQKLQTSQKSASQAKPGGSTSLDAARAIELSERVNLRLDELEGLVVKASADSQYKKVAGDVINKITQLENRLTSNSLRAGAIYSPNQTTAGYSRRCCECLSDQCCSFDIILKSIRLVQAQVEPVDWAEVPGLIIRNEIQFFCWLDDDKMIGILHPSLLGHYMGLRKKFNKPGVWLGIGRTIGTIFLPHGQQKTVGFTINAVESDEGLIERPTAMKDEYGVGKGTVTLDCCSEKILAKNIEVDLSKYGGMGGGALEFEIYAKRVCC